MKVKNERNILDLDGEELEKALDEIEKNNKPRQRFWDDKEVIILRRLYPKVPMHTIAEVLGRSIASCQHKAIQEGIRKIRLKKANS